MSETSSSSDFWMNVAWILTGGIVIWLEYLLAGLVFLLTVGFYHTASFLIKLSFYALAPLGRNWPQLANSEIPLHSNGFTITLRSALWLPFMLLIGVTHLALIVLLILPVLTIPLAHLHWRMAQLTLYPFFMHDVNSRMRLYFL